MKEEHLGPQQCIGQGHYSAWCGWTTVSQGVKVGSEVRGVIRGPLCKAWRGWCEKLAEMNRKSLEVLSTGMTCFDLGFFRSLWLLNWVILSGGQFSPRRHLTVSRNTLNCHFWEEISGMLWVESRDATKYIKIHRTAPTTTNRPVQTVSSTKVKNLGAKTSR